MAQEAQQLKLASLGRLTASIAHEIRNPLAAISHASQLLAESSQIDTHDRRLTEIIQNHSMRVNTIIENILQLSRRQPTQPMEIELNEFIRQFAAELIRDGDAEIDLKLSSVPLKAKADPSQLRQVLINLCENGLRYSFKATQCKRITIASGIGSISELAYIKVIDEGEGIASEDIANIFEPFFTTEPTGSGLGLYLSKELCEANQASLNYDKTNAGKSCFRIDLAHHQRTF